jgi:hypothetical protein
MVTVGDEGFFKNGPGTGWPYQGGEGVDTVGFLNVSTIDFATAHLYPEAWTQSTSWGTQYITDHANAAKAIGKPVILEEYGYSGSDRLSVYQSWISAGNAGDIAGDMFWMLAAKMDDGNNYPDYDRFTIYNDGGDVANYLASHAREMKAKNAGCTPNGSSSSSTAGSASSSTSSASAAGGSTGGSTNGLTGSTDAAGSTGGSTVGSTGSSSGPSANSANEESGAEKLAPLFVVSSILGYLFM